MRGVLRHALARLSARRGRALLAAGGIAAASAMLGAAVTVSLSLATGFDRAANRAGLADVIARFDPVPLGEVEARTRALANLRAVSYRLELKGVNILAGAQFNGHAKLHGVPSGPRGYALVAGREPLAGADEVVIERGLAESWGLEIGETLEVDGWRILGAALRIVGVAVTPDSVAFPLTNGPRLYSSYDVVRRLAGVEPGTVNLALLWVHDRAQLDLTLAQARAASFGVRELEFVTRDGVRALINQAAGIVIALLVAFSLVALAAAGVMLAASSAAEVQRRLPAIGLLRTLGASPAAVAAGYAAEAALVAAPAALLGLGLGALVVARPTGRLLSALNELGPGPALLLPLAGCLLGTVGLVALAAGLPAWRAASRRPVETLAGGDVASAPRRLRLGAGPAGLGMRLALARPLRTAATIAVLAASASVVLLMLALATLLGRLESDPSTLGKRYSLTVAAPAREAAAIRRVAGVDDAAPRYELPAADSFALGEGFTVVAFNGDHTDYEAPPLASGRRIRGEGEAEVGLGLAQALNLRPGTMLAAQLPSGGETRFRVVGVVRALEAEGRIAYVQPSRLLEAEPGLQPSLAVLLDPGASRDAVAARLSTAGYFAERVGGVTAENSGFLDVLAALLLSLAGVVGLVCVYALVQMLALTAHERRRALAVIRALGASRVQVAAVLAGSGLLVAAIAAAAGIVLERFVVAPAAASLAASYVTLPLAAGPLHMLVVSLGLTVAALVAAAWAGRGAIRRPIVAGLREN